MKKDQRGRKKGTKLKRTEVRLTRLYSVLDEAYRTQTYKSPDCFWTINDMVAVAFNDDYITEAKKRKTYYLINLVRKMLKEEHDAELFSVHGKGYCILYDQKDFEEVFNSSLKHSSSRFSTLKRLWSKGELEEVAHKLIHQVKTGQLEDAKAVIQFLEMQTDQQPVYETKR